ncbi:tektin bundle-interacting protein 1 isoform X2 [Ascaphus truei]|uniref:tektin bundle-interacting protein 1 isoform X2 n=1 Tax=Ascaphus truei TaxID=8439 RepID=UPI003F59DD3D
MQPPEERGPVPRRTLEAEFPIPLNSDEFLYLPGPANAPILHQSMRWRSSPWGQDVKCQLYYTGKNREIFYRWAQEHRQREKEALPHAYAQHLRETAWYDPTMPAQYLQTSPRWGAFQWRDRPIPPKEFVLNRHRFGAIEPGTTHTEFK